MKNYDGTKSLFAMSHSNSFTATPVTEKNRSHFGDESSILRDTDAKTIHEENVQLLSGMNVADILAERQELLDTIGRWLSH